jgi:hypothetical protein
MKSFLCNPERSEGTLFAKRFLEGSTMNPKNIGNNKPFFLKSRAQRGLRTAFFARWGGQRGTPIAKKVLEVLL